MRIAFNINHRMRTLLKSILLPARHTHPWNHWVEHPFYTNVNVSAQIRERMIALFLPINTIVIGSYQRVERDVILNSAYTSYGRWME